MQLCNYVHILSFFYVMKGLRYSNKEGRGALNKHKHKQEIVRHNYYHDSSRLKLANMDGASTFIYACVDSSLTVLEHHRYSIHLVSKRKRYRVRSPGALSDFSHKLAYPENYPPYSTDARDPTTLSYRCSDYMYMYTILVHLLRFCCIICRMYIL